MVKPTPFGDQENKVATPADWKQSGDVIIVPSVSDEDAKGLFPAGWTAHKPYQRTTKQLG